MGQPGDPLDAFFVAPGRCFRMVLSPELQASHCSQPVAWRGRWKDAKGRWYRVEACEMHGGELEGARRTNPRG